MHVLSSTFFLMDNTAIITNNSAVDGGGILLSGNSKLLFKPGIALYLINNSARSTGGAIMVEESNPLTYCFPSVAETFAMTKTNCFFQIQHKQFEVLYFLDFLDIINSLCVNHTMFFDNNSAVKGGIDLYGGSVDSCTLNNIKFNGSTETSNSGSFFDVMTSSHEDKPATGMSSDPLCICLQSWCNRLHWFLPPMQSLCTRDVPVIALGQRNGTTAAVIQVIETFNISLSSLEYSQEIDNNCNNLKYTIHSRSIDTTQEMILYAQGPCSPTQTNTLTVMMDILHFPPGFQLSMNEPVCECAERLLQFTKTCLVDRTTVLRERNTLFWVGYDNESRGLILHSNCPFDYCTLEETYMAVV